MSVSTSVSPSVSPSQRTSAPALTVDVSRAGPVDVVATSGELDLASAPLLSTALLEQLRRSGSVVLDLRDLSFVDSGGMHVLFAARRRAQLLPADLAVACLPRCLDRLLHLTGSAEAFETFPSRDLAVAELSRRRARRVGRRARVVSRAGR